MKDQDDIIGANALRDLARASAHGAYRDVLIRCAEHLATLSPPEAQGSRADSDLIAAALQLRTMLNSCAQVKAGYNPCDRCQREIVSAFRTDAHLESQGTASHHPSCDDGACHPSCTASVVPYHDAGLPMETEIYGLLDAIGVDMSHDQAQAIAGFIQGRIERGRTASAAGRAPVVAQVGKMTVTVDEVGDHVCQHGTAIDVHCCNCHSGFIFDINHECPDV